MIDLGLIDSHWPLSPRDARVPAWESAPNHEWQIHRMATYAAMVERMDQGIGRILATLKEMKADQNTLVLFFSDNGACDEIIQPDWFDIPGRTRSGQPVKIGNNPTVQAGPEDVWQSYGVPWANVSDTPFRLYKHFVHEGGIASPFIASWPAGLSGKGKIVGQLAHVTDLMPTCLEVAGAAYPPAGHDHGPAILPLEGRSLLPIFHGETREDRPICWEHEGNRAVRLGDWKLVARYPGDWELYNLKSDRTELNNLASTHPDQVQKLATLYRAWATRCNILPWDQVPKIQPAK
jgi:arylsulfatase